MTELPTGTVTLLFTDIEGSTRLLRELGRDRYVEALDAYRRLLREACTGRGGVEVEMQGDSFHFAFMTAHEAVAAAAEAQRGLAGHAWQDKPIRARIGLHTGEPIRRGRLFAGLDVHRAARIMGAAHGGQVLLSQATRELVSGDLELADLGEYRLKDLSEPERIYQLRLEGLPNSFPPLKSLSNTNLPTPASPLVGRNRELGELLALLLRQDTRLLTLTGTGGTGKTRLALEAAAELAGEYEQGVVWVPLAPLRDPALVLPSIAQALGVKRDLREELGDKRPLLLLDNMERLLEAGPALAELLAACPRLELLVTSRECLHIAGEREYPLPPLIEQEAVELFQERAQAAQPDFRANGEVAVICRALDGLPLAIELAAARVKLLSPAKLLERLQQRLPLLTGGARDLPERQRTLRATIEWSYELLDEAERSLFARLAVFAGGFSLEAAEQVCGAELDTAASLVDKSLLRPRGDRFAMLETIREYAAERLEESGERETLRATHAEHYLGLAEEAAPQVLEGEQRTWLVQLEAEHDNLRAALAFLHDQGEPALELRLAGALGRFWFLRGYWDEGRRWLEDALADAPETTATRARALLDLSALEWHRDLERGQAAAEEAIAIFRALGDEDGLADSLVSAGSVLTNRGALAEARALFEEAVELATASGNLRTLSRAFNNLGDMALGERDYERATDLLAQALAIVRGTDDRLGMALALFNLGLAAFQLDRHAEALARFQESLALCREIEWKEGMAYTLEGVGAALALLDGGDAAARLIGCGDALREELASDLPEVEEEVRATAVDALRRQLGERLDTLLAEGRLLTLEEGVESVLSASRVTAT